MAVIDPQPWSADVGFSRAGAADPKNVAAWRAEFSHWLRTALHLEETQFSDVVLAVDEALSNCAEFAYSNGHAGDMRVHVQYSASKDRLDVEVTDDGCWREPNDHTRTLARGRGIPLMRALADEFTIQHGGKGTLVVMAFAACAARAFGTA